MFHLDRVLTTWVSTLPTAKKKDCQIPPATCEVCWSQSLTWPAFALISLSPKRLGKHNPGKYSFNAMASCKVVNSYQCVMPSQCQYEFVTLFTSVNTISYYACLVLAETAAKWRPHEHRASGSCSPWCWSLLRQDARVESMQRAILGRRRKRKQVKRHNSTFNVPNSSKVCDLTCNTNC